jgi:hypothetical protein
MDGRLTLLLQLLSTSHEASPAESDEAPSTASERESCKQQGAAEDNEEPGQQKFQQEFMATDRQEQTPSSKVEADKGRQEAKETADISLQVHTPTADANEDARTDMQWATGGTLVVEEPWPGLLPEYVPDYTPLV